MHDRLIQVGALVPELRATSARTRVLVVFGMVWSGSITLLQIAQALPVAATDLSIEGRFRRWLKHPKVVVAGMWTALLPALVASQAGQEVTLVLDPTPQNGRFAILQLGLVCRNRVLPTAWRVVP